MKRRRSLTSSPSCTAADGHLLRSSTLTSVSVTSRLTSRGRWSHPPPLTLSCSQHWHLVLIMNSKLSFTSTLTIMGMRVKNMYIHVYIQNKIYCNFSLFYFVESDEHFNAKIVILVIIHVYAAYVWYAFDMNKSIVT